MTGGRDRLRELLDAVLDGEHRTLADMAHGAYSSPFHFSRRLSRDAGEPPVAMRRRVELERAAWQLALGATVTEVAFAAGYGSVEGFSRAYSANGIGDLISNSLLFLRLARSRGVVPVISSKRTAPSE